MEAPRVVKVEVDWMEHFANDPAWIITLDRLPEHDELRYEERNGSYFTRLGDYVDFFHWSGEGNDGDTEGASGKSPCSTRAAGSSEAPGVAAAA